MVSQEKKILVDGGCWWPAEKDLRQRMKRSEDEREERPVTTYSPCRDREHRLSSSGGGGQDPRNFGRLYS